MKNKKFFNYHVDILSSLEKDKYSRINVDNIKEIIDILPDEAIIKHHFIIQYSKFGKAIHPIEISVNREAYLRYLRLMFGKVGIHVNEEGEGYILIKNNNRIVENIEEFFIYCGKLKVFSIKIKSIEDDKNINNNKK